MIQTWGNKWAAQLAAGRRPKGLVSDVLIRAAGKLVMVDMAKELDHLRLPPGNRLEALGGERSGQHSIRINDQWRVCFRWHEGDAYGVEIVDYH
ncbi:MAG: type II toxin-antitoxin system RelE/ParE family toxin [Candidatus Sericytochromatia bacterium]|nr:type II toxin-antitoxin system RelE/ParE family toxin [Candidatus Sericytochromatia bacterium]